MKNYKNKKDCLYMFTLDKLKRIYKSLGININIRMTKNIINDSIMPYSHHICFDNYIDLGANGKGKSNIALLCSAYAELTERVQNGFIINLTNDEFTYAPDEKVYNETNLSESTLEYINRYFINKDNNEDNMQQLLSLIKTTNFMIPQNYLTSHIYNDFGEKINNFITLPFYSIFEDKIVEIPIALLRAKNLSNGMCAGNSKEEALVQGISEILERYVENIVYKEEYTLPAIPFEYYKEYTAIVKLVLYIEDIGKFSVKILDASLEKDFPVICVMFIDKETNNFTIRFGAHPDFTIAIERCLTEFMQGFSIFSTYIKKEAESHFKIEYEQKDDYDKLLSNNCQSMWFEQKHPLFKNLNKEVSDFILNKKYLSKNLNKTNKELLYELIEIIKKMNAQIYIRDVSFLGFNSFTVEIPGISDVKIYSKSQIFNINILMKLLNMFNTGKYDIDLNKISIQNIISALNSMKFRYYDTQSWLISGIPNEFLLFVFNLENKDKTSAINNLESIIEHKYTNKNFYDLCMILYILLNNNEDFSYTKSKYLKEIVVIAKKILNNPLQTFLEYIKDNEYYNTQSAFNNNISGEKYKGKIRNKLISIYKRKLPNQYNLRKIFKN